MVGGLVELLGEVDFDGFKMAFSYLRIPRAPASRSVGRRGGRCGGSPPDQSGVVLSPKQAPGDMHEFHVG